MKKLITVAILGSLLLMSLLLISCSEKEETEVSPFSAAEISGKVLWTRITEETDYTNYEFWPDHEGLKPGQAPHGAYHKVYINTPLLDALPVEDRTAPDGSIIVKENYSPDEKLAAVTVMAKVEGYDPEHGDWFWAKYSPQGEVQVAGKPDGCISCHAGMKDNDYVIIQPLDKAE